jgi:hypothetical protein
MFYAYVWVLQYICPAISVEVVPVQPTKMTGEEKVQITGSIYFHEHKHI